MTALNHYRYALLNSAIQYPMEFLIKDSKWLDSSDKGGSRNHINYRLKCKRKRRKTPLRNEIIFPGVPPTPAAQKENKVTSHLVPLAKVDCSQRVAETPMNQTLEVASLEPLGKRKGKKHAKGVIKSFWNKAYKLL